MYESRNGSSVPAAVSSRSPSASHRRGRQHIRWVCVCVQREGAKEKKEYFRAYRSLDIWDDIDYICLDI